MGGPKLLQMTVFYFLFFFQRFNAFCMGGPKLLQMTVFYFLFFATVKHKMTPKSFSQHFGE